MKTLYRKHVNGLGIWRIWHEGATLYIAHATQEGGSEVVHTEVVTTNNSGRTLDKQIELRIQSRVSRMRDKGYKDSRDEALADGTNQLGLERPMLAQPLDKVSSIRYEGAVLQKKLDGHRCLITNYGGDIITYSRQGKLIPSIWHITDKLKGVLPEGYTLDGELYHHGTPLQTIGSWIKREQTATRLLKYVVYDQISPEHFRDRYYELQKLLTGKFPNKEIILLPCKDYIDADRMWQEFYDARAKGFEGLILRTNDRGYQAGIRSQSLIKIKEFHDEEFRVVGFKESMDHWAICTCLVPSNNRTFDVSAPGTLHEKRYVLEHQSEFLGRKLTVKFAHWSKDGIPVQPIAVRWREDV